MITSSRDLNIIVFDRPTSTSSASSSIRSSESGPTDDKIYALTTATLTRTVDLQPDLDSKMESRNTVQLGLLERLKEHEIINGVKPSDPEFEELFGWKYRRYKSDSSRTADSPFHDYVFLFNIIVAIEWQPSQKYLLQLRSAFEHASDFLFDVTDGAMAIRQVVVGGIDLMIGADIQILASNRLLPRSWVGGLHEPKKYMPIRIGRGLWNKNHRKTIPWNEPEGYRVLVHEWAHYALELLDEYLDTIEVFLPKTVTTNGSSELLLTRATHRIVVPKISLATESIMASLEGTSELVTSSAGKSDKRKSKEWERIKEKRRYPKLDLGTDKQVLDGPERLPSSLLLSQDLLAATSSESGDEALLTAPRQLHDEHCWVYLLRDAQTKTEHLIAQGTFDGRTLEDGFRLLGVREQDIIVLVGNGDTKSLVLTAKILEITKGKSPQVVLDQDWGIEQGWADATPDTFPIVDVVPAPTANDIQQAQVSVSVTPDQRPASIFPLGVIKREQSQSAKQLIDVATLDGHVLLRYEDNKLIISAFSQGGGPPTNTPGGPPPISAGSSEGNVMLFFEDNGQDPEYYGDVRVVTTLIHGMPHKLKNGAEARSYAFSIASTKALPLELSPTLIMYFDTAAPKEGGDILIYRLMDDTKRWTPISTYLKPGASFAAAPLNDTTSPRLTMLRPNDNRVERYRLFWTPHNAELPLDGVEVVESK